LSHSFCALGVSAAVEQDLAGRGIVEPFPIQTLVLPDAFAGRDVLAKAPTGSGKTLAFGLPIVERTPPGNGAPRALVLVPTRELATQVRGELALIGAPKGIRVEAAYGGAPVGAQAKRLKGAHVVVATPGRLQDLADRRLVSLREIETLVLDEADRMLDMGFKPQVEKILRLLPAKRQTMLFSATLDGEVGELAREYTHNPSHFEAQLPALDADENEGVVGHEFVSVTPADKLDRLVELLEADRELALVFVRTKRGADRLVKKLKERGVNAAAMHGDMQQSARERALEKFRSGKVTTLVATDVAARGLDLESISHVINYDPPEDHKGYVPSSPAARASPARASGSSCRTSRPT
jgi:superfamily II DNA/RNA helicase